MPAIFHYYIILFAYCTTDWRFQKMNMKARASSHTKGAGCCLYTFLFCFSFHNIIGVFFSFFLLLMLLVVSAPTLLKKRKKIKKKKCVCAYYGFFCWWNLMKIKQKVSMWHKWLFSLSSQCFEVVVVECKKKAKVWGMRVCEKIASIFINLKRLRTKQTVMVSRCFYAKFRLNLLENRLIFFWKLLSSSNEIKDRSNDVNKKWIF